MGNDITAIIRDKMNAYHEALNNDSTAIQTVDAAESIVTELAGYYMPKPPNSITMTMEEYDALINIYYAAQTLLQNPTTDLGQLQAACEAFEEAQGLE